MTIMSSIMAPTTPTTTINMGKVSANTKKLLTAAKQEAILTDENAAVYFLAISFNFVKREFY